MKDKQIDMIQELLIDFDEMGFAPTTLCPNPEAYAIEWRKKLTEELKCYRKASEVVEEVTDEIFKILDVEYRQYDTECLSDILNKMYMSSRNTIIKITAQLVELKKKYTEDGE